MHTDRIRAYDLRGYSVRITPLRTDPDYLFRVEEYTHGDVWSVWFASTREIVALGVRQIRRWAERRP